MSHWVVNGLVLALVLGVAYVAHVVRQSPMWSSAARQLWARRPVALTIIGLFLLVGGLDSISWIGGGSADAADLVAQHKPRSILDRMFPEDFKERSYSAPLAEVEFYGDEALANPGSHLLGTDILGRDVLHLTLKGVRIALLIGGLTSLIVIPLALLFGISAGYFGGRIDDVVFFVMSTLASIPNLLLLIALVLALGRGPVQVCIALGVTSWVGFCRVVRGETLKLRELDYVQAARALGVSEGRIILRHILPNLMHLVVITFVLLFSGLVLSEAVLAFLGIGIDGSWGQMIDQARDELARDPIVWWNLGAASTALFTLILCVNLVGDAIRDVLDPRTLRETPVSAPILEVEGLTTSFPSAGGRIAVVDDVSFQVSAGEVLSLVGESGCGKSMTAFSVLRLVPKPGRIEGRIVLDGKDVLKLSVAEMRAVRGSTAAMIFQEPMTSLNPVYTNRRPDRGGDPPSTRSRASRPPGAACSSCSSGWASRTRRQRLDAYPHELSGGHEAARDDRDGALDATASADRRRADHRPRRHDPGADPRADAGAAARDGDGDPADHPRPRRRERARRSHRRDVRREAGRARRPRDAAPAGPAPLHPGPAALDPVAGASRRAAPRDRRRGAATVRVPRRLSLLDALPARGGRLPFAAAADLRGRGGAPARLSRGPAGGRPMSDAPLLRVEGLRTWFPIRSGLFQNVSGWVRAVDGVDLEIRAGETLALVGESGCGKTTVGRSILRLEEPREGKILYDGRDLRGLAPAELRPVRSDLQIVFQDPMGSLDPRMRIRDAIAEGMQAFGIGANEAERTERVAALLSRVKLDPSVMQRYPHEFSGGQRQRICIARALAVEPRLIVCDEATSALDVSIQAQILNLLRELQDELGLTYLFITHDLGVVRYLADRVAVMYLGQIVESAETERLFTQPEHPYTQGLLAAVPSVDPTHRGVAARVLGDVPSPANPPEGCRFHTRCAARIEGCDTQAPPWRTRPDGGVRCVLAEERGS